MKENRAGWKIGIYPEGKSCFYFERSVKYRDKVRKIAIDIFFYNDKGERVDENCYSLDLFLRPVEDDEAKATERSKIENEDFFKPLFPQIEEFCRIKEDNGRYHAKQLYSRSGIINVLKSILTTIASQTVEVNE